MAEMDEHRDPPGHPVLYLTQEALFTWEQHEPGGCRCFCQLYHDGAGTCLASAEPGRLLRIVIPGQAGTRADITDALPVCAGCYAALERKHHR